MTAAPASSCVARALRVLALAALPLSGCGAAESGLLGGSPAPPYAVTAQSPAVFGGAPAARVAAPPVVAASARSLGAPRRANADMARDLVDLTFRNEAGESRAVFARWEGPVRVRLAGAFAEDAAFLDSLLTELGALTGLEMRRVGALEAADLRIRAVRPARFAAAAPGALCGSQHEGDWRAAARFSAGIVDIPADASPARRRICLIEEIAQLLGPVNDLERLPDTIFNDDGAHVALTPFDRLMLRVLYAPELKPGMSAEETRGAAIAALARLNPAGIHAGAAAAPSPPESAEWSAAYRTALSVFSRDAAAFSAAMGRLEAAAAALPPGDHRRVKTLTTRAAALLAHGEAPAAARKAEEARDLARASGDEAREAEALGLLARAALAQGDSAGAALWSAEALSRALRLEKWDLHEVLAAAEAARKPPRAPTPRDAAAP